MDTLLTPSNIMFALGILGILFTVYKYFRDPQVNTEQKDALLAQKVQWQVEGTEKRFSEIQKSFQALLLQSNNHIHTLDVKLDELAQQVSSLGIEVAKLTTIIEERMPRKRT